MAKKKPVKKRMKHKPLPPHSYEPFPLTEKGEVNRPLLVAIISVLIAVALVVILFVAEPASVGKAYTGVEGAAGLVAIAGDNFVVDSPFTLTVRANIGAAETVAIGFNLTLPEGVSCVRESVDLGWEATDEGDALVLNNSECDENQVSLEYATLEFEAAQTETFDIARIALQASEAGDYDLNFSLFDIYSLSDAPVDLIENAEDLTITVGEVAEPETVLTLYQHCKSDAVFDDGWATDFEVGSYDTAALVGAGVLDNDASALIIAPGYQVALYDSGDLTGEPLILNGGSECLVDVDGVNFNDVLSSMVVSEIVEPTCTETDLEEDIYNKGET
ncbi:hypothetical protein HOI26_04100, partial [Candidatus Woesearchaeota archaeon]|nr:hypothetical protein [Candidatus Woesearchaeota archaeon]